MTNDDDKIIIERPTGVIDSTSRTLKNNEKLNAWEMMGLEGEELAEVEARAMKKIEEGAEKSRETREFREKNFGTRALASDFLIHTDLYDLYRMADYCGFIVEEGEGDIVLTVKCSK